MTIYKVTPSTASFYATRAGIVTYANSAGYVSVAGFASTASSSTNAYGLTGSPNITVGIATVGLGTTSIPGVSQLSFELSSDTNLRIKVRGSDNVLRSANITLA